MARFISKYLEYTFVARPTIKGHDKFGQEYTMQTPIVCSFAQGGLSPWETEKGLDIFEFKGLAHDEPAERRLSVFDTEIQQILQGWSDEDREYVEGRLRGGQSHGVDYVEVIQPRIEAPWPSYDKTHAKGQKTTADTLARMVEDLGVDPEHAIQYELQNKNRADVIAAFRAIGAPVEESEEVVA